MACQHDECPICMEVFTGITNVVVTECGHKFHTNCLMTSVAHNGFGCPYCRSQMAEDPEESDSDDEGDDMSVDSDFQESLDREENRVLGGVRWLFNRANDEEQSVYDGEDEDSDDEEEEEDTKPKPSAAFIAKKLVEQGVTVEDLVKSMLLSHEEYENEDEEFSRVDDDLFGKMRILISNFQPEQEPKVTSLVQLEDVSAYYSNRFNRVV